MNYIRIASNIQRKRGQVVIPFYNPIKASFSNKKYSVTIQTHPTQIIKNIFLI